MALLLASFGSSVLTEKEDESNKIGEAISRIRRFLHFLIQFMLHLFRREKGSAVKIDIENNIDHTVAYNQVCLLLFSSIEFDCVLRL